MDPKVKNFRIAGVCAAVFQAFKSNGSELDLEWIWGAAENLRKQGVKYAFPCGTNGEGVTMSVEERKRVVEAWVKASNGDIAVIAHVGSESYKDVEELCKHAESVGCAAISAMPPCFFKPENGLEGVIDYMSWVCSLTSLPFYYYHIAARTGVAVRVDTMLEKISALVDGAAAQGSKHPLATFRGVKYSDADKFILSRCLQVGLPMSVACSVEGLPGTATGAPRYDICFGSDEQLLPAATLGVRGAVGSTYNFVGRSANAVLQAFESGDLAAALVAQRRIQAVCTLLVDAKAVGGPHANPMALQKVMLEERMSSFGIKHVSTGGPRSSWNGHVSAEGRKAVMAKLEEWGWQEW